MNNKKLKSKLLKILFSFFIFSIPITTFAYSQEVYLGGENIGIEVKSNGVLVVGFYNVDNSSPGKEAGLEVGDIITSVEDIAINEIADLSKAINISKDTVKITYTRNKAEYKTTLKMIQSDNIYKTGLYIKDKIIGIGTLTYIDKNNKFSALGHQIIEKNTGQKFEISTGTIFKSKVTGIERSEVNNPGEKKATYYENETYGKIEKNEITGIYGTYTEQIKNKELIKTADINEIKTGKAYIKTTIESDKEETFEINILKINANDQTKNILFEITDKNLLNKTGGVVQGMSGSPIIQNNKLIGAVTHVIIDNPKKGYGIFITKMLKETNK